MKPYKSMSTIQRIRLGDLGGPARLRHCTATRDIEITGVAGMEHAGPSELTFLANPKYAPKVKNTRAAAILVKAAPWRKRQPASLISANPYLDFARALALVLSAAAARSRASIRRPPSRRRRRSAKERPSAPSRWSASTCSIGRNAVLHPHVVIYEGAEIGDDFLAHSHAVVREYLPHRPSRDSAERRGGGRRRLRLRQDAPTARTSRSCSPA